MRISDWRSDVCSSDLDGDLDTYNRHVQYNVGYLIIDYLVPALADDTVVHIGLSVEDLMTRQNGCVTGVAGLADEELRCCLVTSYGLGAKKSLKYLRRLKIGRAHV